MHSRQYNTAGINPKTDVVDTKELYNHLMQRSNVRCGVYTLYKIIQVVSVSKERPVKDGR